MRSFLMAGLVVMFGAESALASFELMHIPSPNDGKVYRYDPINRVRMGSFNAPDATTVFYGGGLNPGLVGLGGFGQHRYNMQTGINESFVNNSTFSSISEDGASVHQVSGTTASTMAVGGGSVGSTSLTTTLTMFSGTKLSNGNILGFGTDGTSLRAALFNSSGALLGGVFSVASFATRAANSGVILTETSAGLNFAKIVIRDTAGVTRVHSVGLNNTFSSITSAGFLTVNSFSYNSTSTMSIAAAHSGWYLVGSDGSSPTTKTRLTYYNNNSTGTAIDSWTEDIDTRTNNSVYAVSNVPAPEPGTMLALGAGLVAILRKRKSPRS